MDEKAVDIAVKIAQKKRKTDKAVVDYKAKNLKNHLKAADKINAKFCCVIGEDELNNGTIWVKNLEEKTEAIIRFEEF
jgi:histidyl-tRNA synthetase